MNLPKISQLLCGRSEIWTWVCFVTKIQTHSILPHCRWKRWSELVLGLKKIIPMHFLCVPFFYPHRRANIIDVLSLLFMWWAWGPNLQGVGGCGTISSLEFVSIFQIKTMLYKDAEEKDTRHLCNLLVISRCLIWAESSHSRRARKRGCSTRFTVNKGENRKTWLVRTTVGI